MRKFNYFSSQEARVDRLQEQDCREEMRAGGVEEMKSEADRWDTRRPRQVRKRSLSDRQESDLSQFITGQNANSLLDTGTQKSTRPR